jgi:hypothetical protein
MMIRRGLVAAFAVFAGFAFAQPNPGHPTQPTGRQQDVYAIYSLLMPGTVFSSLGSDQNQRWAVADTTVNDGDINPALAPEAALQAPSDHPKRFHDAVVDYEQRRTQRQTVTRNFHLDRPYTLLSATEIQELRDARTAVSPDSSQTQKYGGYPGITYFSDVYFNPQRSAALVYMLDWCSNFCGASEWIYLEKHDSQWIRRSGQGAVVSGAKPF